MYIYVWTLIHSLRHVLLLTFTHSIRERLLAAVTDTAYNATNIVNEKKFIRRRGSQKPINSIRLHWNSPAANGRISMCLTGPFIIFHSKIYFLNQRQLHCSMVSIHSYQFLKYQLGKIPIAVKKKRYPKNWKCIDRIPPSPSNLRLFKCNQ